MKKQFKEYPLSRKKIIKGDVYRRRGMSKLANICMNMKH
jgi:hypothetical protein